MTTTAASEPAGQGAPTMSELLSALRRLDQSGLPYQAKLAARLRSLSTAYAEDYEGRPLSGRSLDSMLDFLATASAPGYPGLTATPAGDLYAEWQGREGRRLTVEFLDSGDARYLIFLPNPKHPGRLDRLSGATTADALGDTIAPLAHLTGLAA